MNDFLPSRHRRRILLVDWRDAEELAVWHMRRLGFANATMTGPGADKGIDVVDGSRAAAQVKHLASPVGAPDVQRLVGAAHRALEYRLFDSLSGFTRQALEFASDSNVCLFTFTIYGDVVAANDGAAALLGGVVRDSESTFADDDEPTSLGERIALRNDLTASENRDLIVFVTRTSLDVLLKHAGTQDELDDLDRLAGRNPRLVELAREYSGGVKNLTQDVLDTLRESKDQHWPSWCVMLEDWLERMRRLERLKKALENSDKWDGHDDVVRRYLPGCPSGEDLLWHWWENREPADEIDTELLRESYGRMSEVLSSHPTSAGLDAAAGIFRSEIEQIQARASRPAQVDEWGGSDWDDVQWDLDRLASWIGDPESHVARAVIAAAPFALTRDQLVDVIDESQTSQRYLRGEHRARV